jgi:hypothetical protein
MRRLLQGEDRDRRGRRGGALAGAAVGVEAVGSLVDTNSRGGGGESAPSPSRLAAAVRAAHAAMGVGITVAAPVAVAAPCAAASSSSSSASTPTSKFSSTSTSSTSTTSAEQQQRGQPRLPPSSRPGRSGGGDGVTAPGFDPATSPSSGAAANAAALESAMLFGRGGERWLESVRLSARGALVLSAVVGL